MPRRVLVIADSLAFHGPTQAELLTHPRIYPNVLARELGAEVDVVARLGWTARDAWWALTKDPYVYSVLAPRSDAVVLGVGGCDTLPASLPTYLKEGIAYLRPPWLRTAARTAYHRAHPYVVRATGGRLRVLPLDVTLEHLTRCVEALRYLRPERPVLALVPPRHYAPYHAANERGHAEVVRRTKQWAADLGVPLVDTDEITTPAWESRTLNSDGMHWSWDVHEQVGKSFAALIADYWE